jgi:glycosyltransferase involved in cell wall biosynthesis
VANSRWLAEYAGQWNPNSVDIGQGCNPEAFLRHDLPEPDDIKSIPGPIIGYCGAINSMRLSEALLLHIALELPEMSLVLVGPVDSLFAKSQLRLLPNVFFPGLKEPEEAASFVNRFTVCINPQLVNQQTIGNYPRKIDEYLAAGKPVVATATEAMEMFRNYCELCNSKEEFVEAIRKILNRPDDITEEMRKKGRDFALSHSWENSIGALGDAYYFMEEKLK